ncbi:hypothetical protein NHF46_05130 [Arthrobacter alpinus]|nr:hypothetical protein [Arthrobacter alpinus]
MTALTAVELQLVLAKWSAAMSELTAGSPWGRCSLNANKAFPLIPVKPRTWGRRG